MPGRQKCMCLGGQGVGLAGHTWGDGGAPGRDVPSRKESIG